MKHVEVTYLESGTFQGGEEDVFKSGINYYEECVVLRKKDFAELRKKAKDCGTFQRRLAKALETIDQLNQAAIDGEANL